MKHPSRIPILVALVTGVLLVAFGLLQTPGEGGSPAAATVEHSDRQSGRAKPTVRLTDPGDGLDLFGPSDPGNEGIGQAGSPPGDGRDTALKVLVSYSPDGAPISGARASLWRQPTGEGTSFRPGRRLTELVTGDDGRVRFVVTPGTPLEINVGATGISRTARLSVDPLAPGEERSVGLTLERPPEPLELAILDAVTGEPISGAAIRSVHTDPTHLGLEDFPGTTRLVQRTDGEGRATLPGLVRESHWIIIDAAGYSPTTLTPESLDGRVSAELQLERSASLSIVVVDPTDAPLPNVVVTCEVNLGGYRTTFTTNTDRRGEASLPRVPAGLPIVPTAALPDSIPDLFDAITLNPGEERTLRLELSGR